MHGDLGPILIIPTIHKIKMHFKYYLKLKHKLRKHNIVKTFVFKLKMCLFTQNMIL